MWSICMMLLVPICCPMKEPFSGLRGRTSQLAFSAIDCKHYRNKNDSKATYIYYIGIHNFLGRYGTEVGTELA